MQQLNIITKEKESELERKVRSVNEKEQRLDNLVEEKKKALSKLTDELSKVASMTKTEAKEYLLKKHKEEIEADLARISRKSIKISKENLEKTANYMLATLLERDL